MTKQFHAILYACYINFCYYMFLTCMIKCILHVVVAGSLDMPVEKVHFLGFNIFLMFIVDVSRIAGLK